MDLRIIYRSTFKYKFLNFIASQIICDALRKHTEAYYGLHFTRPQLKESKYILTYNKTVAVFNLNHKKTVEVFNNK